MTISMPLWVYLIIAPLTLLGALDLIPFLLFIFWRKKYDAIKRKFGG